MNVPVLLVIILQLCIAKSFIVPFATSRGHSTPCNINTITLYSSKADDEQEQEAISVTINTTITQTKVKKLFAWIKTAFEYDGSSKYLDDTAYYYNNIELAIAAAFGDNLPKNSLPTTLMDAALEKEGLLELISDNGDCSIISSKEWEEALIGDAIGKRDRESASLGAMGAGQWTGQWTTRPHALLDVRNFTCIDDWIKTLPRGCKRTMKKATPAMQKFTVIAKPIRGGNVAPHSSYAHFKCVVEHEVRLISNMYGKSTNAFFSALAEGISRYQGTTRMAGSVREYRDINTNEVIGFAHEVGKGRTMRGQWFYCNDNAATRYVWFHSVYDLVYRSINDERIDTVDLGPSGSDAFTELKEKYGFKSVVDWPTVADYTSCDFIYQDDQNEDEMVGDKMMGMIEKLIERQQAKNARSKNNND